MADPIVPSAVRAAATTPNAALGGLVEAFFREEDARTRASLRSAIEKEANGSISQVAGAVANVMLWAAVEPSRGLLTLQPDSSKLIDVAYRVPLGYDPARRYPMLVRMPDRNSAPLDSLDFAERVLGDLVDGFIMVAPARPIGGTFRQPNDSAEDLPRLMRELRRRFHIDSDRVYLFGQGRGGDAAWMVALGYTDLFAGAIVVSGYPRVPYAEQTYPLLLENLQSLPVLTVWSRLDESRVDRRNLAVWTHNRAIVALAQRNAWPITGIELLASPTGDVKPPRAESTALLNHRRSRPALTSAHWFRYPAQGSSGWLHQTRFEGAVWEAPQLSILPASTTDRATFIEDVIQENLAYLGARIDGQTITVDTLRCRRAELLLPPGVVDLANPVTVVCNGKRRHFGVVEPSIRTLLDWAYDRWDFQRLAVASLEFSIRADSRK